MKKVVLVLLILCVMILGSVLVSTMNFTNYNKPSFFPSLGKTQITKTPLPSQVNVPKDCSGQVTPEITEGPYYKSGSPQRVSFLEDGLTGQRLTLEGYVYDKNCNPIPHALLDFWQADSNGEYDTTGFRLRGHQFADSNGKYHLDTIVPGEYTGRTEHIHVKVKARVGAGVLTTQLYFPDQARNNKDPIYTPFTTIRIEHTGSTEIGYFNFIVQ